MRRVVSRVTVLAALVAAAACGLAAATPAHAPDRGVVARAAAATTLPPVRHVFIIVLENEAASVSFGADSPAPYLAKTLPSEGAYLPEYHAVGHVSNDNYIAMISGQPPNPENQSDCQYFDNFPTSITGSYGAEEGAGCVYPSNIQTIGNQLDAAGFTWRDYDEEMGADPSRESATCAHPAIGTEDHTQVAEAKDMYATRHNPFVYFHSIIDNQSFCDSHVVNLNLLPADLASASTTPNYVFIVPDLCDDGHDSPCADGEPGGLVSANAFLEKWVPKITSSPAFKDQNGLLIVTFDESADSDTSSCCGEIPGPGSPEPGLTGPGGGDVGAVLLSPCIKPGTVSMVPYNHYSMLRSIEDLFGLGHLGYAQLPGETDFGSDIFTRACNLPPSLRLGPARVRGSGTRSPRVLLSWSSTAPGATFDVQVKQGGAWRALLTNSSRSSLTYAARSGATYSFRVSATNGIGLSSLWKTEKVVVAKAKAARHAEREAVSAGSTGLPPIRHVFVIVLENESASVTFGANPPAPYLAKTLTSEGAYLPEYHAVGHNSNDNYIAMISGQAPNTDNEEDCQIYGDFPTTATGSYGQQEGEGCIYPADIQNIATQLDTAGYTWRDYNQSMGNDPTREAAECGHPAVGSKDGTQDETSTDAYATRHNPFVYFHSIIDDTTLCDTHVVNLNLLPGDLANAADTPNYVFITPDLCSDGHDAKCSDPSRPGGFAGIEQFLQQWVPQITRSPAFKQQNGLLLITFDEAATSDTSACCGEIPGPGSPEPGITGPGGGDVGAVLLSPCIKPGTVSTVPYNHYSMLRTVEDLFGLPHLGYAQLPGESDFGSDVFTKKCNSPPGLTVKAPALASQVTALPRVIASWSSSTAGASFEVQARRTSGASAGAWQTLLRASSKRSVALSAKAGETLQVRVMAVNGLGLSSRWTTKTIVFPTGAKAPGAQLTGHWRRSPVRDAWEHEAIIGSGAGSAYTLSYTGGSVAIIGSRWPQAGRARITFDGRARTIDLRSSPRPHARQVLYRAGAGVGRHTLTITVLSGDIPIEGLAITNLR